jgi:hypothetical protein
MSSPFENANGQPDPNVKPETEAAAQVETPAEPKEEAELA